MGGSGLCPTRKATRKRSGSRFSTRNRPVKRVGFRGSVCQRVASVSGKAETRRKTAKIGEISPDLAKIRWGFRQIWLFLPQILSRITRSGVSMPNLIVLVTEICQIKLKTRRNQWRIRQNWCLRAGRVSRVLNEGTQTDPPALGFGTWDPWLTAGAVRSGEHRLGTGGLDGWPGGLDSPILDPLSSVLKVHYKFFFYTCVSLFVCFKFLVYLLIYSFL